MPVEAYRGPIRTVGLSIGIVTAASEHRLSCRFAYRKARNNSREAHSDTGNVLTPTWGGDNPLEHTAQHHEPQICHVADAPRFSSAYYPTVRETLSYNI